MLRKRWMAAVAATCMIAGSSLAAQEWAGRGRLQGEIKDEQGKPVVGAQVTFRIGDKGVKPEAPGPKPIQTNEHGKWSIGGLAGGTWGVLIQKEGYLQSEGTVKVDEFSPSKPVNIVLKAIPKEAIAAAQKASAGGIIDEGDKQFTAGKWAEARAEYEKALDKIDAANKPKLQLRIAKTYLQEKNYDKVSETLQAVLAVDSTNIEAITMLAATQYELKQTDKAIDTLKAAIAVAPDNVALTQQLVNFLVDAGREEEAKTYMAKLPQGTKVDPASLLNIGIRQYNDGKLQEALESFDRVVKENPSLAEAYYYRGLCSLGLSKIDAAKADFKKLLELEPNSSHAADAREFLKSL